MNATHDICPYTLKRLADLPSFNGEHIFPDSIGGTASYIVRVDTKTNSQLGTTVDSACAGEAGCHAGESPAGRIRLFTTESCVREEAVRPNPKARRGLNCPVVTTVNLIE